MNPNRTEIIKRFLVGHTHPDLAALYTADMECQVNVARDGGMRTDGEYNGIPWQGWTDGQTTWKSFRIPFSAMTDPVYQDRPLPFDLEAHAEGVGMTGWDWQAKKSRWVAFDFDTITGHSELHNRKLSPDELQRVQDTASAIPWVCVRRSTSGKGLHLYVFLEPITTVNHTEHAAVGRSVLGKLSALTGFDFGCKVDAVGGNMWVWHRKMKDTPGLQLIKKHTELAIVPVNWKDHVRVVAGRKRRVAAPRPTDSNNQDSVGEERDEDEKLFDDLAAQHPRIPLDESHRRLLAWILDPANLKTKQAWWDQDRHMLICHTETLKDAHVALTLRGVFQTASSGSSEHNIFCYPMRNGAWVVRRYGMGVGEAVTWGQDNQGYTRCFLNKDPDLATAARAKDGIEDDKKVFHFTELETAVSALQLLGISTDIVDKYPVGRQRNAYIKELADGRISVSFDRKEQSDSAPVGWLAKKDRWLKVFDIRQAPDDNTVAEGSGIYDDILRHISNDFEDQGWSIRDEDGQWKTHPLGHVTPFLKAQGLNSKETQIAIGRSISKSWTLVNLPFREEYPGNRRWNRGAAQLAFGPSVKEREALSYPHWLMILRHLGQSLDDPVNQNTWCKENAILTGMDYLKAWVASMFQNPLEPLPYLFFYSEEQNTGKSIFYESLSMLMTRGFIRAESALSSQSGFNGELANAILCATDEFDLSGTKNVAGNRIKDWVTSKELPIHFKGQTPFQIANSTHWVQMGNDLSYCPLLPGDTRIVVIRVKALEREIPKFRMLEELKKEAPDFLAAIMAVELPKPEGRLYIPVLETQDKIQATSASRNPVQVFFEENCYYIPGSKVEFSEVYDLFIRRTDPAEAIDWGKNRFGKSIPTQFLKGRIAAEAGTVYIGNLSLDQNAKPSTHLVIRKDRNGQAWLEPFRVQEPAPTTVG